MSKCLRVKALGCHSFQVGDLVQPTGQVNQTTIGSDLIEYKRNSDGKRQWLFTEEVEEVEVAKFNPMQTKPTKNLSVKPVDIKLKTLYVVVKDGKPVYTTTKRSGARAKKLSLGGLKAGVTIVTYKPQNEIR